MQYMFTGMLMALIGGFTVYAFRMQLAFPGMSVPGYGRVTATDYNALISRQKVDMLLGTFSSLLNLPASTVADW